MPAAPGSISLFPVAGGPAVQAKFSLASAPGAHSIRWSASTSNYPVVATVATSGVLETTNPPWLENTMAAVPVGARIFITIVPFSAPHGGGTALPAIHLQATHLIPR